MFFKERCQDSPSYNKLLLIFFMFCSNQLVHSTFSAHCTRTAQSGLLTSRYEIVICKCNASILVANTYIQFIWYCQLVAISVTFQAGVLVSLCQLCYKRPCLSSFVTDSVIDDFITVAVTECWPLCDSSCRLLVFWKKIVPTFWDHLVCWQNPSEGLIN